MGDMVNLTDGKRGWEVRELALKLIQSWGIEFASKSDTLPLFHQTYTNLRVKGVTFPEADASVPIHTPPAATDPSAFSQPTQDEGKSAEADDLEKLKNDLVVVEEKVKLCREMLPESRGIEQDEALSEVIGFLEACKPRMVDLIEAGMQGMLDEGLLGMALAINDDLIKTLEAEKNGTPLPPMSPSTTASGGGGAAEQDLLGAELASVTLVDDEEEGLQGRRKKAPAGAAAPTTAATPTAAAAAPADPFAGHEMLGLDFSASAADVATVSIEPPTAAGGDDASVVASVSVVPPTGTDPFAAASPVQPMPAGSGPNNPFGAATGAAPMPMGGSAQAQPSIDPFATMGQPGMQAMQPANFAAVPTPQQPMVMQVNAQPVVQPATQVQPSISVVPQNMPPPPPAPGNAQQPSANAQNFDPFA